MQFATGSHRYAAVPAALAVPVALVSPPVSGLLVVVALAVLFFHRDPDRELPPSGVVAPADGRVSVVREEGDRLRVGIYMSGRDVHVNRAPMAGVVEAVDHVPGANKLAFSKESERNERLRFEFEDYTAEMIAGAFARRTHSYVDAGEFVERGQRLGHISFSSRFDVVFPPEYGESDLTVAEGTRVYAGETVIARPNDAVTVDEAETTAS